MYRIKYIKNSRTGIYLTDFMMDSTGENVYQAIIHTKPVVQFEIRTTDMAIYFETAPNVATAKRNAKFKLEELGIVFKKEIRFKKNEAIRKKVYQQTRS